MSWETQSWAAKQRPGSASAKLVLLGLASCADANHCAFPSVQWLCDFSDLNRKTVISAIQRLEDGMFPLIEDTGERRGRTGQVKVYRLAADDGSGAALASDPAGDARKKTVPKPEQFQKRNSSGFSGKQSQKRDTEPVLNPPLSTPDGVDAPPKDFEFELDLKGEGEATGAKQPKPHALPDGWEPPGVDDLQPEARALVKQWPPGAYQVMSANFANYWRDTGTKNRKKSDWKATLCNWLIRVHSEVKRAEKAGVSYAVAAPVSQSAAASPGRLWQGYAPVAAKAREDAASEAIRAALVNSAVSGANGDGHAPVTDLCAILCEGKGVIIVSPDRMIAQFVEHHMGGAIRVAARQASGEPPGWVRYDYETQTPAKRGANNG